VDFTYYLSGKYKVTAELGAVGAYSVLQCVDPEGSPVTLRLILESVLKDVQFPDVFLAEVQSMAAADSPHLVKVREVFKVGETFCIATEQVEGRTLDTIIRQQGAIPPEKARVWALQIAEGLKCLHGLNIIHGGVSSSEVIITPAGTVKLVVPGLAKHLVRTKTYPIDVIGDPNFMPPERVLGNPLDSKSDIFSFGMVLFHMVTGRLPATNDEEWAVLQKDIFKELPPPSQFNPRLPGEVDALIAKAISRFKPNRHKDIAELAAEVSAAFTGAAQPQPVQAPHKAAPVPVAKAPAPPKPAASSFDAKGAPPTKPFIPPVSVPKGIPISKDALPPIKTPFGERKQGLPAHIQKGPVPSPFSSAEFPIPRIPKLEPVDAKGGEPPGGRRIPKVLPPPEVRPAPEPARAQPPSEPVVSGPTPGVPESAKAHPQGAAPSAALPFAPPQGAPVKPSPLTHGAPVAKPPAAPKGAPAPEEIRRASPVSEETPRAAPISPGAPSEAAILSAAAPSLPEGAQPPTLEEILGAAPAIPRKPPAPVAQKGPMKPPPPAAQKGPMKPPPPAAQKGPMKPPFAAARDTFVKPPAAETPAAPPSGVGLSAYSPFRKAPGDMAPPIPQESIPWEDTALQGKIAPEEPTSRDGAAAAGATPQSDRVPAAGPIPQGDRVPAAGTMPQGERAQPAGPVSRDDRPKPTRTVEIPRAGIPQKTEPSVRDTVEMPQLSLQRAQGPKSFEAQRPAPTESPPSGTGATPPFMQRKGPLPPVIPLPSREETEGGEERQKEPAAPSKPASVRDSSSKVEAPKAREAPPRAAPISSRPAAAAPEKGRAPSVTEAPLYEKTRQRPPSSRLSLADEIAGEKKKKSPVGIIIVLGIVIAGLIFAIISFLPKPPKPHALTSPPSTSKGPVVSPASPGTKTPAKTPAKSPSPAKTPSPVKPPEKTPVESPSPAMTPEKTPAKSPTPVETAPATKTPSPKITPPETPSKPPVTKTPVKAALTPAVKITPSPVETPEKLTTKPTTVERSTVEPVKRTTRTTTVETTSTRPTTVRRTTVRPRTVRVTSVRRVTRVSTVRAPRPTTSRPVRVVTPRPAPTRIRINP
jgi:serine/threonine-protein kinase